MKTLLGAVILTALAGQAMAIERYQTMRMTCDEVQSVVQGDGAAILRWQSTRGTGLPIYGRYVSDGRFCKVEEVPITAFVPTQDRASCPVRKCQVVDKSDRFIFRRND